jgi:hypothetical protein
MGSFIARALLWFIFGFFIHDIINEFNKLFGMNLNPYFAIVPTILFYVFQEFLIKKWTIRKKSTSINDLIERKRDRIFYIIAWLLTICLMLSILIVWLGVTYKAVTKSSGM